MAFSENVLLSYFILFTHSDISETRPSFPHLLFLANVFPLLPQTKMSGTGVDYIMEVCRGQGRGPSA